MYELLDWAQLKEDCHYDHDNNGYIFGVHYLDENGQVIDAEWFKTNEERMESLK